ncbi:MAG: hypothetical protein F6J86_04235 [Symploca sp. SIO1B1]|nr:hypothetical protein [Symploca sp. SIO1A3]NER93045.1 hypothetical protein [Symploca sp. SIO1B1]
MGIDTHARPFNLSPLALPKLRFYLSHATVEIFQEARLNISDRSSYIYMRTTSLL